MSPSGRLIAAGGLDNICSVYSRDSESEESSVLDNTSRPKRQLRYHEGYVSCCRFVDEGQLLTASGDSSCVFWDIEREQVVQVFKGHKGDVMALAPTPDACAFVSVSCDSTARLWDLRMRGAGAHRTQSTAVKQIFVGHEGDVNAVDFMSNGVTFATGSDDTTCRLFDIRADREMLVYQDAATIHAGITSVAFSQSGRLLFSGCEDGNVYVWDVLRGTRECILSGHDAVVSAVCVSPSGQAFCSSSWDGNLKVSCAAFFILPDLGLAWGMDGVWSSVNKSKPCLC